MSENSKFSILALPFCPWLEANAPSTVTKMKPGGPKRMEERPLNTPNKNRSSLHRPICISLLIEVTLANIPNPGPTAEKTDMAGTKRSRFQCQQFFNSLPSPPSTSYTRSENNGRSERNSQPEIIDEFSACQFASNASRSQSFELFDPPSSPPPLWQLRRALQEFSLGKISFSSKAADHTPPRKFVDKGEWNAIGYYSQLILHALLDRNARSESSCLKLKLMKESHYRKIGEVVLTSFMWAWNCVEWCVKRISWELHAPCAL